MSRAGNSRRSKVSSGMGSQGRKGRGQVDRALDERIGALIRSRRVEQGLSQQTLGNRIGLTFQQIQKYEKGTNQLSVGRLLQVCGALEVSVSYFLDTRRAPMAGNPLDLRTARAIAKISDQGVKRALVRLAQECRTAVG